MAYTKITSQASLPIATSASVDDPSQALHKYSSDLAAALELYLNDVLLSINDLIEGRISTIKLQKLFAAPVGPEDGWLAFADGTVWNPGSGIGLYLYKGGAWHFIA